MKRNKSDRTVLKLAVAAAGLTVAALICFVFVEFDAVPKRAYPDGKYLAAKLIEEASKGNTIIVDKFFPGKICIWPADIGFVAGRYNQLFSNFNMKDTYVERDSSDGYWYIYLSQRKDEVEIYAIPQNAILFETPQTLTLDTAGVCPLELKFDLTSTPPRLLVNALYKSVR